jgi:hypothetical protein
MTTLPAPVYLHIGAMKTGTTYLQQLMFANQERLAAAGYLLPGGVWARQVRAVQDALGITRGDPRIKSESTGAWQALVQDALAHTGKASVLSMEFLSFARPSVARRLVASLAPADVHVVLTVRDATGTIPAQWQTNVQSGSTISWPDFQRGVRKATTATARLGRLSRNRPLRAFQRAQGIPRMLEAWGSAVAPGRLHVVTVPPPGSDPRLLWERLASVVGIDPAVCEEAPERTNASLGHPSAELLRRVNVKLGRLLPTDYNSTLSRHLALQVLAGRDEPRAKADLATRRFGVEWNAVVREAIAASNAEVVGNLDDLPVQLSEKQSVELEADAAEPSEHLMLAAAAAGLDLLQALVRRRARRLRQHGVQTQLPDPVDASQAVPTWMAAPDPVDAAASDLAALARTAIELHRRIYALPAPPGGHAR